MADIRKRQGKKGTTYQVRYPSKAAKSGYAFKTFGTLKEARSFNHDSSLWKEGGNCGMSVSKAIELWLEICETEGRGGRKPVTSYTLKTYKYMADIMCEYDWDKDIDALTSPDIIEFRSWLLRHKSRSLAKKALSHFQSVLREMQVRGYLDANIGAGISVSVSSRYKKLVEIPTMADIRSLLAAADKLANSKNLQISKAWQRYRPMLYLAVDSGMRPQEYLALGGASIHARGVQIERAIERSGKMSVPKTAASRRFVDLSPEVLDMITHYRDNFAHENKHDLVFPTKSGHWQTVDNWRKLCFVIASKAAGLTETVETKEGMIEKPKFRAYSLRHFYASMLIAEKVNLKKIQTLMGHKNISTTFDIYGHLIETSEETSKGVFGMLSKNS